MEPFIRHSGIAAPLDRANVDTDAIVPKQFLRKIDKVGFGKHLFHEWRYTDYEGTKENPDFVLNKSQYRNATVLLARDNFGCGSSREHAVWALTEYGFQSVITPGFADIFYNNSLKNGLLLVALPEATVNMLLDLVEEEPDTQITVDLASQTVTLPDGQTLGFDIDPFRKICLMEGVDDLGYIMKKTDAIAAHEAVPVY